MALVGSVLVATPRTGDVGPKNAISLTTAANVPRFAIGLGYDRRLHRRITAGARVEYTIPNAGYAHIQGITEGLALALWAPRAFRGFFAEASLGVAHSFLAVQPDFQRIAMVPGLAAGLRWRFGKTFFIGAHAGLRWVTPVRNDSAICTYAVACPATNAGPRARAAIDLGFAF